VRASGSKDQQQFGEAVHWRLQDFVAQALSKGAASGFAGEDNLTTPGTGAAAQKLEVGALARTINALQDNHHGNLY
jgi:hypothetical protein